MSLGVRGLRGAQATLIIRMVILTPTLPLPSSDPLSWSRVLKEDLTQCPEDSEEQGAPPCATLPLRSPKAHTTSTCPVPPCARRGAG